MLSVTNNIMWVEASQHALEACLLCQCLALFSSTFIQIKAVPLITNLVACRCWTMRMLYIVWWIYQQQSPFTAHMLKPSARSHTETNQVVLWWHELNQTMMPLTHSVTPDTWYKQILAPSQSHDTSTVLKPEERPLGDQQGCQMFMSTAK